MMTPDPPTCNWMAMPAQGLGQMENEAAINDKQSHRFETCDEAAVF